MGRSLGAVAVGTLTHWGNITFSALRLNLAVSVSVAQIRAHPATMTMKAEKTEIGFDAAAVREQLEAILGREHVLGDPADLAFFSTDLAQSGKMTAAVAKVTSLAQLTQVVALCTRLEVAIIPRGGGFSYTGGYTPDSEASVTIDLRALDSIIEINEEDLYVRVECGCTWERLFTELRRRGLRTPYYGPMSGYSATVGGALSQGSFFLGSTEYGTVMDSVLSVEVVLANGDVIHTGSDSAEGVTPFYRNYGPDVTGLFLADTGSLGIKSSATLKLIRTPKHQAYGSFSFTSSTAAMAALSEIGRSGLAAEAYLWDPFFVQAMSNASTGLKNDLAMWFAAIRNSAGPIDGLSVAVRLAIAGKSVFRLGTYMIHATIDDHSKAGAAARLRLIRRIAFAHGAREVAPSIPRALRATPFTNFNVPERRSPLRNLPTNSLYSHSRAPLAAKDITALFAAEADAMAEFGATVGTICFAVGRNAMCIEPLIYWNDPHHMLHDRITERSDVKGLANSTPPGATAYVLGLRERLKGVMARHGAVHVQIGRSYNYLATREPRFAALLRDIKASVDPHHLINPGSLGL
jgi:FAD/FMN-containing dehydrogenase